MSQVTALATLHLNDAAGEPLVLDEIGRLLLAVKTAGTLAAGAQACNLSYRYAWGRLRDAERRLGAPLLSGTRGRGSRLSPLGECLIWATQLAEERLSASLDALSGEVGAALQRAVGETLGHRARAELADGLRLRASHGYAVAALVAALQERGTDVDLKYRENAEALSALAAGECDLAGFYVPIGAFRAAVAEPYRGWLAQDRHCLIRLTRRKQGLYLPHGNPLGIVGLRDLARDDVRVVNRQPGSGTRVLLDLLLAEAGVDPAHINSSASTELTHSALAAFVASGMADAGFGVQPAATQFGLDFVPVAEEDYFFACERDALDNPPLAAVLAVLRDAAFQAGVSRLAGYEPVGCGEIVDVDSGLDGRP
ncbi:substrate-binding domain-containing protein [Chitinasiproducens palmae]|uniref:ModE molybdate transport repressor domain-containing protein n=1 Tax=Chitinasiproducens palmae TaxID=1770053 RepID=A0A1H2PIM2_9BURK|nr:substrate-binding domain-containing protein [Chitinasiproducens palmae]SDV46120.1 ModE molybdate transport repressor domain-containing protein [Chitinasiproducens palmae]